MTNEPVISDTHCSWRCC